MRHGFTNEMLDMEQNGTVLKRIDAMGSAECWWCVDAGRSVMHLYTKYQKSRTERQSLRKNLTTGIWWQ